MCRLRIVIPLVAAMAVASLRPTQSAERAAAPAERASAAKADVALETAAAQRKFTFILFWRENNTATKDMLQALKGSLADHGDRTTTVTVNVTDPAEKNVVARFDVSRSPMPLVLAVAPNGAVTGVFSEKVTAAYVAQSLVTPRMTECMKAMQGGKLVLLCVQPSEKMATPPGVKQFVADPHYSQRTTIVSMQVTEPEEKRFLKELQVSPASMNGSTVVFMAPPGVMVGKFSGLVSKDELAMKLHAAGKCCDDPNCKHNHQKGN